MKIIFVLILASSLAFFSCSNSGDSAYFPSASPTTPAPEAVNTGTQETENETGNDTGNEQPQETNQTEKPNSGGEETNNQGTEPGNSNEGQTQEENTTQQDGEQNQNQNEENGKVALITRVTYIVNDGNGDDSYTDQYEAWSDTEYIGFHYNRKNVPVSSKTVPNRTVTKENIVYKNYKVRPNDDTTVKVPYQKQVITETYKVSYKFAGWKLPDGTIFGKDSYNESHFFKNGTTTTLIAQFEEYEEKVSEVTETLVRTVKERNGESIVLTKDNAITFEEFENLYGKRAYLPVGENLLDEVGIFKSVNDKIIRPVNIEDNCTYNYAEWEKQ